MSSGSYDVTISTFASVLGPIITEAFAHSNISILMPIAPDPGYIRDENRSITITLPPHVDSE